MPCTDAERDDPNPAGPKPESGRLVARMNALTRGLRSEHGLVPPHLADAVAKHHQMLIDAYHPATDHQSWLLDQVADAAARLDHCQFMLRAQIDDMADRADLCWEEDRMRAVEEIAARLPKDPSRTASRLRETSQGCRWILARWTALSVPLIENTPWNEDQCNLAARLMGVGPDLRASHPTLNPSASPADQADIMCEQADAVHVLMMDALEPLDAKERELTRLGYPLRPSKEFLRLQRYEGKLRKVYNEAMQTFRQARAEHVNEPAPITGLTPNPTPVALPSAQIQCLAPEPEPIPRVEVRPLIAPSPTPTLSPKTEPARKSLMAALAETFAEATPVPPTVRPLSAKVPVSRLPLNRKARRALEKAARKQKATAA
jgi:hypothetical protein